MSSETAELEQRRPVPRYEEPVAVPRGEVLRSLQWLTNTEQKAVSMQAALWFLQVRMFHEQEDAFLVSGKYDDNLSGHRVALAMLIRDGEMLVAAARETGLSEDAPFKLDDIQAAVETLHGTFHAQHRNGSTEETSKQVAALFPDEE